MGEKEQPWPTHVNGNSHGDRTSGQYTSGKDGPHSGRFADDPGHRGESAAERPDTAAGDAEASHEQDARPRPLIYVADLTAADAGQTHGVWLDAAREPSAIYADIQAMLDASPLGDPGPDPANQERASQHRPTAFAIHDYEAFGNCTIRSDDSIELVAGIARGIRQHGYAFAAWADVHEGEPELATWVELFETDYIGHFPSLEAYIRHELDLREADQELARLVDGSGLRDLAGYITIDSAALARDMYAEGAIYVYRAAPAFGGGVWLFRE